MISSVLLFLGVCVCQSLLVENRFRFVEVLDFDCFVDFAVRVYVLNVPLDFLLFHFIFFVLATSPNAEENQTATAQQTQKQR
jgi:hypothetical protein